MTLEYETKNQKSKDSVMNWYLGQAMKSQKEWTKVFVGRLASV